MTILSASTVSTFEAANLFSYIFKNIKFKYVTLYSWLKNIMGVRNSEAEPTLILKH
jgi:hypothetical protein